MKKLNVSLLMTGLLMLVFLVSQLGCKDENKPKPVAEFTGTPTSGTTPLTVNFTDQSINIPTSWQWNFGEGGSSTQQNPSHTYNSAGTYTVELVVNNSYGSDSKERNNYITVTSGEGIGEPCPGVPTITYEGQTYNTVLIGSQCWMKENLNVGTMISGTIEQSDNETIEKYCYNNLESHSNTYGGLYQWDEAMQYSTQQGAQGICPPGWHIPTDDEWKILEGTVDSQYDVGNSVWNNTGWRGFDVGKNLKSTSRWNGNGNGTDLYGFTGLPGGTRYSDGSFTYLGGYGIWWSSTETSGSYAWTHALNNVGDDVGRYEHGELDGFSIRCIKD